MLGDGRVILAGSGFDLFLLGSGQRLLRLLQVRRGLLQRLPGSATGTVCFGGCGLLFPGELPGNGFVDAG